MASTQTARNASSSRNPSSIMQRMIPHCYCGLVSPIRTSTVPATLGKKFYGCANYWNGPKCTFFWWIDLPQCDCGRDELVQEVEWLERQLEKTKAEERRLRGMLWCTWVAIICFVIVHFY
ncbi:hypothetical protein Vadar_013183 [Vaccinium darrowii]|uniref:Uncharacterized protein n=1 Tax=Vaccinium darrowii TaxID=229202 RepID=A0ACB7Y7W9_9ERIC|nr:hypothetical protein Vadar_013183 [Vaccinium darrowii]